MSQPKVETATAADQAAVVAALTLAFSDDPAARWSWSDPQVFLETFPRFALAFGGAAFAKGTAHRVAGHAGAALWLPPGVEPDEAAMGEMMARTVSAAVQSDVFRVMEQMTGYHPGEPHWYLPMIGVDPARQGKGLGGALLKHATDICDREGALAYLESSNPRNVPLYERHGFEILGSIQVGSSPTIVPMLRKPGRR